MEIVEGRVKELFDVIEECEKSSLRAERELRYYFACETLLDHSIQEFEFFRMMLVFRCCSHL